MSTDPSQPHSLESAVGLRASETSARNDSARDREPSPSGDIRGAPADPQRPERTGAGREDSRNGSAARRFAGRLGPVEWGLLAVIILAIGVTVAMAVFNPG